MRIASKAALLTVLALLAAPGGGAAAGGNPTKLTDVAGDSATAPDLTSLKVDYKGDDALMVEAGLAGGGTLAANSRIVVGFDTDHDASTGGDGGAEYLLVMSPAVGTDGKTSVMPVFYKWNGTGYPRLALRSGLSAGGAGNGVASRCSASATSVSRRRSRSSLAPSSPIPTTPTCCRMWGALRAALPVVYSLQHELSRQPAAADRRRCTGQRRTPETRRHRDRRRPGRRRHGRRTRGNCPGKSGHRRRSGRDKTRPGAGIRRHCNDTGRTVCRWDPGRGGHRGSGFGPRV